MGQFSVTIYGATGSVLSDNQQIRDVTLILDADLFGEDIGPDEAWSEWTPEYAMLRPADAPLVYAPARLDRMDVVLGRSLLLGTGAVASASIIDAPPQRLDQPDDAPALIARRLGWVIALLAVIALILLFGVGETDRIQRLPLQIAEQARSRGSAHRARWPSASLHRGRCLPGRLLRQPRADVMARPAKSVCITCVPPSS